MSGVTVDASVWIAAQDSTDPFCASSRTFLLKVLTIGAPIHVPSYARVEVACGLARKFRNALKGQRLADKALTAADVWEVPMDQALMTSAFTLGTAAFLRGADALYAATAEVTGSTLISWDKEHRLRAGASSPDDWLAANP